MALIVTFMTTPLTTFLYPAWYQIKVDRWRRGEIDWDGNSIQRDEQPESMVAAKDQLKSVPVRKLFVYLRLDGLSGICTLAALLTTNRGTTCSSPRVHPTKLPQQNEQTVECAASLSEREDGARLQVHGVRLMELTDRDSSVMKVASAGEYALSDPVINTFRAFGEWHDLSLMAGVSVVPERSYADTVIGIVLQETADFLLLPWSETGTLIDRENGLDVDSSGRFANGPYTDFVSSILERVPGHIGILVESSPVSRSATTRRPTTKRSASATSIQSVWTRPPTMSRSHHIFLPFVGGEDDRFSLRFVLQLAQNEQVTATIFQVPVSNSDTPFFETMRDSLSDNLSDRVIFQQSAAQETITDPAQLCLTAVRAELNQVSDKAGSIVVVGRRSLLDEPSLSEDVLSRDTCRALGTLGAMMVRPENKVSGSVLVLQAGLIQP